MSVLAGIFTGALVGVYFAEKNVSFPVKYNRRPEGGAGSLVVDLQIFNNILRDVKESVDYRDKREALVGAAEPHL